MKRQFHLWGLGILAGLTLNGCSPQLPQAEREFSSTPTNTRIQSRSLMRSINHEQRVRELNVESHESGTGAALVEAGFFAGRQDGYAVWRDGTVAYIDASGALQLLDKLPTRLDDVLIAGRRIVGLHANGTMGAWNTADLSQQVIIRPQNSTFEQVRVYDTAVARPDELIMAVESQRLERWSLTSGNHLVSEQISDAQPRAVSSGHESQSVVYGTFEGEIREMTTGETDRMICQHDGPVLNVQWLAERNQVLSTAKDGTVLLCDIETSQVLWRHDFRHPSYNITVSGDENYAVLAPAFGRPVFLNLETQRGRRLRINPSLPTTRFLFAPGDNIISQHGAYELRLWRSDLGTSRGYVELDRPGNATGFAVARRGRYAAVVRDGAYVSWYDLYLRRNVGLALVSETEIISISVSDNGEKMLLVLIDGRVLTLDTPYDQGSVLRLGQAE